MVTNNVPNLDCLPIEELKEFAENYRQATRAKAKELVGERVNYTRLCKDVYNYACNKVVAMECRLRGDIQAAFIYERICDNIYNALPEDLQW